MTQEVVIDRPPLYDEIVAAFGLKRKDAIVFSWGKDRIYNPDGVTIPPYLVAHEAVHGERQGQGQQIIDWWKQYIEDRAFRLQEEIPAHLAEYQHILRHGNRHNRRAALLITADRLAAPLYGQMITPKAAVAVLKAGEMA